MHGWKLGLACVLAAALLTDSSLSAEAASAPTTAAAPGEAPLQPTPWVFSHPLRADVLFAAGYSAPWLNARSAWVSSDGKRVAFFARESPAVERISRTLVVKDVDTDAVVFEKVLFSEEESVQHAGSHLERLARARAQEALAQLEQYQWRPLTHHELPSHEREFFSDYCFEKQLRPKRSVSLGDLKLAYQEPRVQLWRRGKKVLDRRISSWRVRQEGCTQASPSWLNGVFLSREQGVLLLELGFCGMDLCPEPPTAFHALRIPSDKPRVEKPPSSQVRTPSLGYEAEGSVARTLYVTGLPAISKDGSLVALAEVFSDGPRGDPNLLLTVRRPQTHEIVWRFPVLGPGEVSAVKKSPPQSKDLDTKVLERIRQANDYLGQTQWGPLEEQPIQPVVTESCQQGPTQKLQLPELELTFSQGQLVLKQGAGSPPISLNLPAKDSTAVAACQAPGRSFIDAVYVDEPRRVVLLRLTTCSDEACPEQDGWYHALELRSGGP
jgi:CheY-like chemotaxis protein